MQRPSLLLDGEWERVEGGVRQLAARYTEEEAARLASAEPLLLVEDLEQILEELGRCASSVCRCLSLRACLLAMPAAGVPAARLGKSRQPAQPSPRPCRCRLLPQQQPRAALLANPGLAGSVSRLSHLSLW